VDGPEFDGHEVDFDELMMRLSMYKGHEDHQCRLEEAEKEGD
jgi:ferredoxin--NADP+ reductase